MNITISEQAKAWASYIAKEVKTKTAHNAESMFLIGRTLLDKNSFNKINNTEDDVVHGVQVMYGPFTSKHDMHEFISEYPLEWPGHNEWRYIYAGKPEIISSYTDLAMAEIVHNASLEFQGQLVYNEQQRIISEIEQVHTRINNRLDETEKMKENEKQQHITWQMNRIKQTREQLGELEKHLIFLESIQTD